MMRVVHLIPRLPPAVDGLGDYAQLLGESLARHAGLDSAYVVSDGAWQPGPGTPQPWIALAGQGEGALAAAFQAVGGGEALLLHYVNYAYQARGLPTWLVAACARLRRALPAVRLVTMFHELYDASAPPWRSAFWLGPRHRRIAAQVARLSDAIVTNLPHHRACLARWLGRAPDSIALLPVFSNIGEPAAVPGLAARPPGLVVFGGAGTRARVYAHADGFLAEACQTLGVTAIHDLGPDAHLAPDQIGGVPVQAHGVLPAAAVSQQLLAARFGAVDYPQRMLGKSGIYAAYCSHGLATVATRFEPARARVGDAPLLCPGTLRARAAGAVELARRAHAAYHDHDLAAQARRFAALLAPGGG